MELYILHFLRNPKHTVLGHQNILKIQALAHLKYVKRGKIYEKYSILNEWTRLFNVPNLEHILASTHHSWTLVLTNCLRFPLLLVGSAFVKLTYPVVETYSHCGRKRNSLVWWLFSLLKKWGLSALKLDEEDPMSLWIELRTLLGTVSSSQFGTPRHPDKYFVPSSRTQCQCSPELTDCIIPSYQPDQAPEQRLIDLMTKARCKVRHKN